MIKVNEKEETSLFQFNATKLPTADSTILQQNLKTFITINNDCDGTDGNSFEMIMTQAMK